MDVISSVDKRICINCYSETTRLHKNTKAPFIIYEIWARCPMGWLCSRCNDILRNKYKIVFKGKQISVHRIIRKGICTKCGKKIGDSYINCKNKIAKIKKTAMHHKKYHDDDILKDTVEMCASCHGKLNKK